MAQNTDSAESSSVRVIRDSFSIKDKEERFNSRIALLDNFRGFAILLYMLAQVFIPYQNLGPVWFPHDAGDAGIWFTRLGLLDYGPIMFYFLIGMTAVMAFGRRAARKGYRAAYTDFIYRNMTLIALDAVVSFFINRYMFPCEWNIIRSVGLTGLLTVPFLRLNTKQRAAAGITVLLIYQYFREPLHAMMGGQEGGIAACFGFMAVVLIVSVLKDLYDKGLLYYFLGLIAVMLGALISYSVIPMEYREYSSTYLLFTTSLFGAAFLIFALFDKFVVSRPIPIISWFGQSLIVFFLIGASSQLYSTKLFPADSLQSAFNAALFVLLIAVAVSAALRANKIIVKV